LHVAAVLIYWGYCEFLGDFPRKVILKDSRVLQVRFQMNACGDTEPQAQTKEKIQTKQISRPPVIKRKPQQPTTPQSEASKANSLDLLPAKSKIGAGSTTPNAFSEGTRQTRGDGGAINRGEEKQAYLDRNFDYIRRKIQEYLRYPAVAVRMGWQGMVTLRFILQKDGNVEGISVTQSSGFNILDENAKKAVKKAAPFSPPPFPLEITLPVDYRLR
jgi:protein TonB